MTKNTEKRPRKIKGHALTMTWSGEYGPESTSTGTCRCGWSESGSSQFVVRDEYSHHLNKVWRLLSEKQSSKTEDSNA